MRSIPSSNISSPTGLLPRVSTLPRALRSSAELADLGLNAVESAGERHIHEFRLGVHLKAAHDGLINLVVDGELLALVLGIGLKSCNNLRLLVGAELSSRDNGDLLLLVELLVELGVLLGDLVDEVQALVLSEHSQEL